MPKREAVKTLRSPPGVFTLQSGATSYDPALSQLFASSSGPILAPSANTTKSSDGLEGTNEVSEDDVEGDLSEGSGSAPESDGGDDDEEQENGATVKQGGLNEDTYEHGTGAEDDTRQRKRKRRSQQDDDLETVYLQKLAREEEREEQQRRADRASKRLKGTASSGNHVAPGISKEEEADGVEMDVDSASEADEEDEAEEDPVPMHESLQPSQDATDLEKAARTCFVGNVSVEAITSKSAKKTLTLHLSSFLQQLPENNPPHKVESLRFRSTAYANAIPRKAAFARKEVMDATTHGTNAYVVYSTKTAAREAAIRLNGTVVLGRHIRVDSVAHPAKVDHRRCVFVGNLAFVDDETNINENSQQKRKKAATGDVEEGLWQAFSKAGKVESVRVVRDSKTRVGKGFAYVQFEDENAVEAALLYNEKKFPPLLPRKLRVVRAKRFKKADLKSKSETKLSRKPEKKKQQSGGRAADTDATLRGRVKKLLGRAGVATMKDSTGSAVNGRPFQKPEAFVFEGHRATSSQGNQGLRLGGKGRKKGKPQNRGTKRAAAWRAKSRESGGGK